jgi:hypothetical protein
MPKKKTAAKKPNKSAFIRNFPAGTPAAEIVQKAKAAGLKLSTAFVYAVRSKAKAGDGGKKTASTPGRKPSNGGQSASDFVRAQPASMKAKDVVAAGGKQGLKFSANLVYMVRSKGDAPRSGRRGPAPRALNGTNGHSSSAEADFRKLAIGLGIGRARELLLGLERRLAEIIG